MLARVGDPCYSGWIRREIVMNRMFWGLQILAACVLAGSSVMLVREWLRPSADDVSIVFDVSVCATGGTEYPLVIRIHNPTLSEIRIVGMNWC